MVQYKAGYKFVEVGVHAQVLDFPAAISCGADLDDARKMLGLALVDVAETLLSLGEPLPLPDPAVSNPEMDQEEPIYLHFLASSEISQEPAGVVSVKRADLLRKRVCSLIKGRRRKRAN